MAGIGKTALAVHAAHRLADRYPGRPAVLRPARAHRRRPAGDRGGRAGAAAADAPGTARDHPGRTWTGGRPGGGPSWPAGGCWWCWTTRPAPPRSARCCPARRTAWRWSPAGIGSACWTARPCCRWTCCRRRRRWSCSPPSPAPSGWPPSRRPRPRSSGLCGHLPLAIRIAATRLAHRPQWTVATLAGRLREERGRLAELTLADRGVSSAFALSYAQLEPGERRMFRLLGLHPGADFDAWSAAALAGSLARAGGGRAGGAGRRAPAAARSAPAGTPSTTCSGTTPVAWLRGTLSGRLVACTTTCWPPRPPRRTWSARGPGGSSRRWPPRRGTCRRWRTWTPRWRG